MTDSFRDTAPTEKGAASDLVLFEREGHVALLTLNRPDRLNALTWELFDVLQEAWAEIDADPEIRVVVLTGAGRAFCAGADMVARTEGFNTEADIRKADRPMPTFTARQCKMYKPVITAVNGVCAGAGLHFVVDSDIVIAASSATFTDTHVNVGQVTALEPIGLSRKIPLEAVLRMVAMGKTERMTAQRAYELGMVSQVVDDTDLMDTARSIAEKVSTGSPEALRSSIQTIWESLDMGLEDALVHGYQRVQDQYAHPDSEEGPRAFVEKRPPEWTVRRHA